MELVVHVSDFYCQVQLEYILEREGGWDSVQVKKKVNFSFTVLDHLPGKVDEWST